MEKCVNGYNIITYKIIAGMKGSSNVLLGENNLIKGTGDTIAEGSAAENGLTTQVQET